MGFVVGMGRGLKDLREEEESWMKVGWIFKGEDWGWGMLGRTGGLRWKDKRNCFRLWDKRMGEVVKGRG